MEIQDTDIFPSFEDLKLLTYLANEIKDFILAASKLLSLSYKLSPERRNCEEAGSALADGAHDLISYPNSADI